MAIDDADGNPFDGQGSYRLTVTADVPVSQYWSVTVYDRGTHTFIQGSDRLSRSSLDPDLTVNPDGTVDLYFGPQAPAGHETNWIPTHSTDFEVMLRLYGPTSAFSDKTWTLPDIQLLP
ncbi:DUF1214 domain-containing protein [Kitasatospora sp. NPDC059673]|uniref:DUF1214 domain-containing protein n=1 Tax=Kitasatospora sp. NPDC059673 TaxID=3346901 RepID=UPI0036B38870